MHILAQSEPRFRAATTGQEGSRSSYWRVGFQGRKSPIHEALPRLSAAGTGRPHLGVNTDRRLGFKRTPPPKLVLSQLNPGLLRIGGWRAQPLSTGATLRKTSS